ncbi:MAG: Gfo/Idh/MocA family oxidoreductase [Geminicoccaceae bacterium]|nr:Gfo/Idh/MocA family oxidoreductase [Geminicoccaceae bacterium]
MTERIGVGLIGTGFMGKCHALAFRAVRATFPDTTVVRLRALADVDPVITEAVATAFDFERWTTRWQDLIDDPEIGIVAITTPNFLHQEMALAAIQAGKHVYCEKPLALDAAGARTMAEAAERAGVTSLVGYNYLRSPAVGLAHEVIQSGEIGDVIHFRGAHFEDFLCDPMVPRTWRLSKATAGGGALGDMGSHVVSLARHLVGAIEEVTAAAQTVIPERPDATDASRMLPVDVDDQAQALLAFANGAHGTLETSWLAQGRKMGLTFEITGTRGAILFDQERMNEIRLFKSGEVRRDHGFKTILMGPDHPHYAYFCPAPGHGLGFNDLKVIEVKALLDAIRDRTHVDPDFRAGYEIARVIEAIQISAAERRPVRPADV